MIPGTLYVATIYSVGWENGTRAATFSVGNDRLTVNQDHFGDNNGIRFIYRYVATATSITLTYTPLEGNSIHTYGFSNYEFGPPQIANPSFEIDPVPGFPGYGTITAWAGVGGGINNSGGPFHDNGAIPNGSQIAFKQSAGPLSQLVSGFVPGASYRITYSENARNCCGASPNCEVKIGGQTIVASHLVTPVGGANPYHQVTSDAFVATSTDLLLEFIKIDAQPGDSTLLLDNVGIVLPNTPVSIALQPQSQTVGVGDTVAFSVVAGGSAPISYQWRKGIFDLPGENGPTLTLNSVTLGDSGNYSVHVSNLYGMMDSTPATLIVRSVVAGLFNTGVDDFGAALADGTVDPHYKLIVNPDGGSTDAPVQDSTVFPIVAGPWLANNAGSKWIGPRLETSGAAGGDYTYRLTVDLTGFDPSTVVISGDWTSDNAGSDILVNGAPSGQSNPGNFGALMPFTLNSGFLAGINTIDFKANNAGAGYTGLRVNRIRGLADALPPGTQPFIVTQPQDVLAGINDTVTLSVRANGSAPLNYQWFYGADPLPGQTGPTISLFIDFPDLAGDYSVEVSNGFGSIHSATGRLEVTVAPLISTDPQNQFAAVGESVTFTVVARGIEPFTYQWCRGTNPIPGATDATLTINNVSEADAGQYLVKVSNQFGTTPSGSATLTVGLPIPGVFNTGVDDFGDALPDGAVDPHYRLVESADPSSAGPDAFVVNAGFPIPPWLDNNAGSKWIAPQAGQGTGNQFGRYRYQITFDLTGLDPATARVEGAWTSDNEGLDILINGSSTGQSHPGNFGVLTPFSITSGFRPGPNTIDFVMNNAGTTINPTGLRVDQIHAIAVKALTVVMTSPTNGTELEACTTATIQAEVSPASASAPVVRVDFFANGAVAIGSDTSAPYETSVLAAPPGVYSLTAVATDTRGVHATSAPVVVTVVDHAPQITCPTGVSAECTGGLTPVTFIVTATDLCEGPTPVTCIPPSGTGFRIGTSNVVCTSRDSSGTTAMCSFIVTVVDTMPPQINCPTDISVETTNAAGQTVPYSVSAFDACGIASLDCEPNGSFFPVGVTTVTCRAVDRSGNSNACSFRVTVRLSNQCPEAKISFAPLCVMSNQNTVLLVANEDDESCIIFDGRHSTDADGDTLTYSWFADGGLVPFSLDALNTNCFPIGEHDITLMVDDGKCIGRETVHIEVVTACDLVENLIQDINNSTLPRNKKRPLIDSLKKICKQFEKDKKNKFKYAIQKLEAFQKKLKGELKNYPVYQALFNAEAQSIIDAVNCAVDIHEKKHKHDHDDDGHSTHTP